MTGWLSLLKDTFDRLIPHQMNFVPILGAPAHSRSSDAFVDDTSVGFTLTLGDTQYSDLILQLQEVVLLYGKYNQTIPQSCLPKETHRETSPN